MGHCCSRPRTLDSTGIGSTRTGYAYVLGTSEGDAPISIFNDTGKKADFSDPQQGADASDQASRVLSKTRSLSRKESNEIMSPPSDTEIQRGMSMQETREPADETELVRRLSNENNENSELQKPLLDEYARRYSNSSDPDNSTTPSVPAQDEVSAPHRNTEPPQVMEVSPPMRLSGSMDVNGKENLADRSVANNITGAPINITVNTGNSGYDPRGAHHECGTGVLIPPQSKAGKVHDPQIVDYMFKKEIVGQAVDKAGNDVRVTEFIRIPTTEYGPLALSIVLPEICGNGANSVAVLPETLVEQINALGKQFHAEIVSSGLLVCHDAAIPAEALLEFGSSDNDAFITTQKGLRFRGDIQRGYGEISLGDMYCYKGFFKDGLASTYGHLKSNVYNYVGTFVAGDMHGNGILLHNGGVFFGHLSMNSREGVGVEIFGDGSVYIGAYEHGIKNGHGTLCMANGESYTGMFKNDELSGRGKYTWADGRYYEGFWGY